MTQVISMRDAKAQLSKLAAQAEQGAEIIIARRGRPTARLVPVVEPRKPIDLAQLQALTEGMVEQPESAGQALRRLREHSRY